MKDKPVAGLSRRAVIAGGAGLVATSALSETVVTMPPKVVLVDTPSGPFKGRMNDACSSFWAIRYGRDTTGSRFLAPQPVPDHTDPVLTGGALPSCPQPGNRPGNKSEDCLYLNLWTPRADHRHRPVMVYFHGGAYSTGSVLDPLNVGYSLATRGDVVVVTVNHRLNALGYLYLPDRFPDSGNNGQLDLICALQWIQRNIASFGGDPKNVTLFGQSGGGAKIATLMAMPAAKGLFHKAITMSGQQVTASGPLHARQRAQAFLDKLEAIAGGGVDPATCPVDQLIAALSATDPILGGGLYMGPVLDMRNLTRHPFWPDAPPQSRDIPMLLGNTVMETRAFYSLDSRQLKGLDWSNLAQRIGPEMRIDIGPEWVVEQFRARYPKADPVEQFHRIVTAARSWRGQVEEAEARVRGGRGNTFVYQLDFEQATHTDDIGLAFGTTPNASPAQQAMSDTVMDAFLRFARTGNPGWPAYELKDRQTMLFDTQSRVVSNPRQWERDLFARVPYIQPGS